MKFRSVPVTGRENNFGAIRLVAALLVIWGHGEDMIGAPTPFLWSRPVSQIGLDLFFCVSGYLIYDSWLRDPRLGHYLVKRALRILPGLAVCVMFCIVVIGGAATTLPLSTYFSHHGTWQFLLNIAFYLKLYLPGVFADRRLGGAVNGSLWSLFPEVLCYLAVPLIYLGRSRLRGVMLFATAMVCGSAGLYMFAYHPTGYSLIYSADPKYVLVEVPFFMAGAAWRQARLRVPSLFRSDVAILMCVATFALPLAIGDYSVPFRWFTLSYTVLTLGEASTPGLRQAMRLGDLSYGAYLYAFPVQQFSLRFGDSIAVPTVITFALAYLSWHLVEHPALRWKPGGGRSPEPAAVGSGIDWRGLAWRLTTRTPLLPAGAALVCLAVFASHLGEGGWHESDYVLFGALRVRDWTGALPGLMHYPISGLLLASYGSVAIATHTAGLASALLAWWLGALVFAGLGAWFAMPQRPFWAAGLALAPFAYVLAVAGAIDAPTMAVNLLPTIAGMTAIWFFCDKTSMAWRAIVLLVAAGSSAAGAGLAVGLACGVVLFAPQGRREIAWLALPALVGAAVLAGAPMSLAAAPWLAIFSQPGALILFAVGYGMIFQWAGLDGRSRPESATLVLGFAAATAAATAAGERSLAPLGVAFALAAVVPLLRWRQTWWAPAVLAMAFYPALTPAALEPRVAQMTVEARSRTWASARRPGDAMEFYLSPNQTSLFGLPPGTYPDAPALLPIRRVFGKEVITICNAWQQPESWLIDGRFIPACPPHLGPPDRVANTRP